MDGTRCIRSPAHGTALVRGQRQQGARKAALFGAGRRERDRAGRQLLGGLHARRRTAWSHGLRCISSTRRPRLAKLPGFRRPLGRALDWRELAGRVVLRLTPHLTAGRGSLCRRRLLSGEDERERMPPSTEVRFRASTLGPAGVGLRPRTSARDVSLRRPPSRPRARGLGRRAGRSARARRGNWPRPSRPTRRRTRGSSCPRPRYGLLQLPAVEGGGDVVGDDPCGRLGEHSCLRHRKAREVADRVHAGKARRQVRAVHRHPPVDRQPGALDHLWHAMDRNADEEVIRDRPAAGELRLLRLGVEPRHDLLRNVLDSPLGQDVQEGLGDLLRDRAPGRPSGRRSGSRWRP